MSQNIQGRATNNLDIASALEQSSMNHRWADCAKLASASVQECLQLLLYVASIDRAEAAKEIGEVRSQLQSVESQLGIGRGDAASTHENPAETGGGKVATEPTVMNRKAVQNGSAAQHATRQQ